MRKLNLDQKKTLSVFFNNLSVAILTTGVVVPVFTEPISIPNLLGSIMIGSSLSCIFLAFSLIMINKRGKSKND